MTEKRFKLKYINEQHISANLYYDETFIGSIGIGGELIAESLNNLSEENEQLKQEISQLKHWNKCLAEKRHQELLYHNYNDCERKKEIEDLLKPKRMNCSDR